MALTPNELFNTRSGKIGADAREYHLLPEGVKDTPGVCGGVLPVRLIQVTWVWRRLARLQSEGIGCSCLDLLGGNQEDGLLPRVGVG